MRILKVGSKLHLFFSDKSVGRIDDCSDELYKDIVEFYESGEEELIKEIVFPELYKIQATIQSINQSKALTNDNGLIKLQSISNLSLPKFLIDEFLLAEKNGDSERIESLTNFWKLCSLNPNAEARENTLWFLSKYGFKIGKSGLFETFRHVLKTYKTTKVVKSNDSGYFGDVCESLYDAFVKEQYERLKRNKKSPKNYKVVNVESGITLQKDVHNSQNNLATLYDNIGNKTTKTIEVQHYTDQHTKSFDIVIGHPVTMDRKDCDERQDAICSSGLHVSNQQWLSKNRFGNITLRCLVNPMDVVAVPPQDSYGKMRTSCYYPIEEVDDMNIQNIDLSDYESKFLGLITYSGKVNNQDFNSYVLQTPSNVDAYELIKTIKLDKTV